jgi:hypothetical protein
MFHGPAANARTGEIAVECDYRCVTEHVQPEHSTAPGKSLVPGGSKDRACNAVSQRTLPGRTGRVATGRRPLGREAVVWVRPGRCSGGCGGGAGVAVLSPDASPPVPVEWALIGGTVRSGKAPTSSPAGRTHTRVGLTESERFAFACIAIGRISGGGGDARGVGGLTEVLEDALKRTRLGDKGDDLYRRARARQRRHGRVTLRTDRLKASGMSLLPVRRVRGEARPGSAPGRLPLWGALRG